MLDINQPVEEGSDLSVMVDGELKLVGQAEYEQLLADGRINFPPPTNYVRGKLAPSPDINDPAQGNLHGIGYVPPASPVAEPPKKAKKSK